MVLMATLRSTQCLALTDVRQLTVRSKEWAVERHYCLSLVTRPADVEASEQQIAARAAQAAILSAPFGIVSLSAEASSAADAASPSPGHGP